MLLVLFSVLYNFHIFKIQPEDLLKRNVLKNELLLLLFCRCGESNRLPRFYFAQCTIYHIADQLSVHWYTGIMHILRSILNRNEQVGKR